MPSLRRLKYRNRYERLLANSAVAEDQNENACWLWTGGRSAGYGVLSLRIPGAGRARHPKKTLAHRCMEQHLRDQQAQYEADMAMPGDFELAPETHAALLTHDETIEHLCNVRICINPNHWIIVSRAKNTSLMQERVARMKQWRLPL